MGLNTLQDGILSISQSVKSISKPMALGTGVAVLGGGALLGATVVKKRKKRKASKTRTTRKRSTRVRRKTKAKPKKKYKYARTAGKGKDTSTRRIRQTKNGQPYVILKNGRAKFISRKSARLSRRRKGGRY